MKAILPPPGTAVAVEVTALVCMTVLVALGKLPSEGVLALATLTVSGYAFARAGGGGPPSPPAALAEHPTGREEEAPPQSIARRVGTLVVLLVLCTGIGRLVQLARYGVSA